MGDCRCLLESFDRFTLKHIFREANGCANNLAKARCVQLVDYVSFTSTLAHVPEALAFDSSVVIRFRLISSVGDFGF